MRFLAHLSFLFVAFAAGGTSAGPENVLVEGFFFTRPKTWTWDIPEKKAHFLNRFVVPGKTTNHETDVIFFFAKGATSEVHKRVLANFAPGAELAEPPVAGSDLKYVAVCGTATAFVKNPPQPNYCLVGVTLRSKLNQETFFIRIFGPRVDVEPALPQFKQMIEDALKEEWE